MSSLALINLANELLVGCYLSPGVLLANSIHTAVAVYSMFLWYAAIYHYALLAIYGMLCLMWSSHTSTHVIGGAMWWLVAGGWLLALALALAPLSGLCCFHPIHLDMARSPLPDNDVNIWQLVDGCLNGLTLVVMFVCYVPIIYKIVTKPNSNNWQTGNTGRSRSNNFVGAMEADATKRLSYQWLCVSVLFALVLAMDMGIHLVRPHGPWAYRTLQLLFTIQSGIHPLIYGLFSKQLMADMRDTVLCGCVRDVSASTEHVHTPVTPITPTIVQPAIAINIEAALVEAESGLNMANFRISQHRVSYGVNGYMGAKSISAILRIV